MVDINSSNNFVLSCCSTVDLNLEELERRNISYLPFHYFLDNNVIFGPGKAANAGGVATSGLEMIQNSMRMQWSFDEVDAKLKFIMYSIFDNIYKTICDFNLKNNDLLTGANIAGFDKIYRAMLSQGF